MTNKSKYSISVFYKIMFIFMLGIVPIYAMSIWLNMWGANNIRKEISRANQSQIQYYMNNFEDEVKRIAEIQGIYVVDNEFNKLALFEDTMTDYQRLIAMSNIQSKLYLLKNISLYIQDIKVYMPANNMVLDSRGHLSTLKKDVLQNMLAHYESPFFYQNGQFIMNITSNDKYSPTSNLPALNISVEISEENIKQSLSNFVQYKHGAAVFINHGQNRVVSKEDNMPELSVILNEVCDKIGQDIKADVFSIKVKEEPCLVIYKTSDYLNSTLLIYIAEKEILKPLSMYYFWIWASTIFIIIAVILSIYLISNLIEKPIKKILHAFHEVEAGAVDITITHNSNDEFKYLYIQFNKLVDHLKLLIGQVYEQKILAKNAEMKQLQYQINPHFLYNCIFLIYRMAKVKDYESIIRITQHLGNYYKFITQSAGNDITIIDEVNQAKDYMEVQTMRFSNRLRYEHDEIPEGLEQIKVPRLILQPVIENCYNHGLINKLSEGLIRVSFFREAEDLSIVVEDNGEEMDELQLEKIQQILASDGDVNSSGLFNVHRRLQIRYGQGYGLCASRSQLGGLCMRIKISLGEQAD